MCTDVKGKFDRNFLRDSIIKTNHKKVDSSKYRKNLETDEKLEFIEIELSAAKPKICNPKKAGNSEKKPVTRPVFNSKHMIT